jgi:mannan endo-1,6-alpha-mannosidase
MILSKWLATLLSGALAVQGALAIDLNIADESMSLSPLPIGIRGLI